MRVADVTDKQEAKEKKREKKRKRKDRERGMDVDDDGHDLAVAPVVEDDGYVSPEFDLPDASSDEDDHWQAAPPAKRSKGNHKSTTSRTDDLEADEELALRLLWKK
ncbi:hypothetical protein ONZ45_g9208 [Pleurotus djamor]|nr:hypothetical protein ONZ45_g9208 [Pleurotus djamor]